MTTAASPPNRLKELRERAGKSPVEMALALDVSVDTIRRLEKPEELITAKYIAPLTDFLGVTSDRLLGLDCSRADQLALDEVATT